jgi:hypothetical protein
VFSRVLRSALGSAGLVVCVAHCSTEQPSAPRLKPSAGEPAVDAGGGSGTGEGGRGSVSVGARAGQTGGESSDTGGQRDGAAGGDWVAPDAGGAAGQPAAQQPAGGGAPVELNCHDGGPGEGSTCQSFCAAWFPICLENASTATTFEDEADCLAQCMAFSEEQLCCRGYHVTIAPDKPTSHCPHAAGIRNCP